MSTAFKTPRNWWHYASIFKTNYHFSLLQVMPYSSIMKAKTVCFKPQPLDPNIFLLLHGIWMSREESFWINTEFIWNWVSLSAWQRHQKMHMNPETYFSGSTSCIKWKIKQLSIVPFFSCIIRSSQLNYKGSVNKSIWVSEQHSVFTIQKVKHLHSVSSLKGIIFINSFFFPFPISCSCTFWYAMQTGIS